MTYLVFDTQAKAKEALEKIWANMQPIQEINAGTGEIVAPITTAWAIEQQRLDGLWIFPMPDLEFLNGVNGYTEEDYSQDWFDVDLEMG